VGQTVQSAALTGWNVRRRRTGKPAPHSELTEQTLTGWWRHSSSPPTGALLAVGRCDQNIPPWFRKFQSRSPATGGTQKADRVSAVAARRSACLRWERPV